MERQIVWGLHPREEQPPKMGGLIVADKKPRLGSEPTTCWLKEGHPTDFAKELSPQVRAGISQASHMNALLQPPPPTLCLAPNTGHPPPQRVLESSRSNPHPCNYCNTTSLAWVDSPISGANVTEEKLHSPRIEPTTFWLKDGHPTNFAKELSPLVWVVITQASHMHTILH